MNIIKAGYKILTSISEGGIEELKRIEQAARTCYRSEGKITEDGESAKKLVERLVDSGHYAMLEHSQLSVEFTCDRAIAMEIVRHRIPSYAMESTRFCSYNNDRFGNEITVIEPFFYNNRPLEYETWKISCSMAEKSYFELLKLGSTPQEARSVLPNSLATRIVVTANFREWRHIFKMRTAPDAHPQIREIMVPLLNNIRKKIPIVFDQI